MRNKKEFCEFLRSPEFEKKRAYSRLVEVKNGMVHLCALGHALIFDGAQLEYNSAIEAWDFNEKDIDNFIFEHTSKRHHSPITQLIRLNDSLYNGELIAQWVERNL